MEVSINSASTSTTQNNTNNSNRSGAPPILLNATLEDEKLYFSEEIVRLEHSIKLLTDSNAFLKEQDNSDPDFVLAISENEQVINKYKRIVKNLKEKLNAISAKSCLSNQININKDDSVSESELNNSLQSLKLNTQEISISESIPQIRNSPSEENDISNKTEKDTVKSETNMSNEEEGVFL
ncbi:hypothetical protein H8356DRAFT_272806 [Neocallimastix lanati (nom. inval.)]|uniref:Uncharacterized protein n=1 Tax=Neocallimastix californiae TaxID=1754190 RepID=A0A1Y2A3V5_9FUNG|nr:hypothetical protein H8356DRAFT_272806 [Neocallimastix sp. JGI-2020a]ORY17030.1 hypothetical protein LY90DRAFT_708362 [Neocallimastix californiae]|eukprot:ORY17030.1 hypothetical protein LY90DRAFT_708362 [Neocallimastix californiae]